MGGTFDDRILVEMLEHGPVATLVLDAGGTIVWASPNVEEHLGYASDDLVGTVAFSHFHPDDVVRAQAASSAIPRHHVRARGVVFRLRQADGGWVECLLTALPKIIEENHYLQVGILASPMRVAAVRALERAIKGHSVHESLGAIVEAALRSLPDSFSLVYTDHGGGGLRHLGALPPSLAGVTAGAGLDTRSSTPWAEAVVTGNPVHVEDLDVLPADVAAAARERGWEGVAVVPVPDPSASAPLLLVAWVPDGSVAEAFEVQLADGIAPVVAMLLEREHHVRTLREAATHDPLTGLANRTLFFPFLSDAIAAGDGPASVLYLDLDGFKPVNDELGHDVGDAVLVEIGSRLAATTPPGALGARLGGDEFAVALPSTEIEAAERVAGRLLAAIRAPMTLADGSKRSIGVSIGVALAAPESDADLAVRSADRALRAAKNAGKGCIRVSTTAPQGEQ